MKNTDGYDCKICLLIQSVALFLDCCIIFGWLHPIRIITAYACRFICFFTGYIWCYNRRSHLTQIIWVTPICDNLSILSIRSIWWNMRLNRSISTLERLKNHKIPQFQPNFTLCASPYILQLAKYAYLLHMMFCSMLLDSDKRDLAQTSD